MLLSPCVALLPGVCFPHSTLHQVCAAPDQLLSAVQAFDANQLQPFPAKGACSIAAAIDDFMGRNIKAA